LLLHELGHKDYQMPQQWDADIHITAEDAAQLIEQQFPALAPARPAQLGIGWDNAAFLVNERWVFRFPRRTVAAKLLDREIRVLPLLAPQLPLPISCPLYAGGPTAALPHCFAGYPLLLGNTADRQFGSDAERAALAPDLARFLHALHHIAVDDATRVWAPSDDFARTDIQRHAPKAKQRLRANLTGLADADIASLIERLDALAAAYVPPAATCWVHGDLYARHLVLNPAGGIAGVIDWGDVHIGDPAADLSIAWSFLPAEARPMFREVYGAIDTAMWDRACFRAIYYGALLAEYGADSGDQAIQALGAYVLRDAIADTLGRTQTRF
jgi:aminoglycoside phosphotransferase (APT) family kinase protein